MNIVPWRWINGVTVMQLSRHTDSNSLRPEESGGVSSSSALQTERRDFTVRRFHADVLFEYREHLHENDSTILNSLAHIRALKLAVFFPAFIGITW